MCWWYTADGGLKCMVASSAPANSLRIRAARHPKLIPHATLRLFDFLDPKLVKQLVVLVEPR